MIFTLLKPEKKTVEVTPLPEWKARQRIKSKAVRILPAPMYQPPQKLSSRRDKIRELGGKAGYNEEFGVN